MCEGGGGGGGEWCGRPGRQVPRGSEMENVNENYFLCLTDFKLLSQRQGNSVNYCDIFKFIFCVGTFLFTRPWRHWS